LWDFNGNLWILMGIRRFSWEFMDFNGELMRLCGDFMGLCGDFIGFSWGLKQEI
jgi:hypothetical protein